MSLPGMYPALLSILAGNAVSNISGPLGKGRDTTWRNSRHFLSHRSRANRRVRPK